MSFTTDLGLSGLIASPSTSPSTSPSHSGASSLRVRCRLPAGGFAAIAVMILAGAALF